MNTCGFDAGRRASDHDLAGGVVVGDPHVGVGAAACDVNVLVVEAEDRGHRAGPFEPGVVHCGCASGHQADAVVETKRAGGSQCGVFAERMAGTKAGLDPESFGSVEHHEA